VYEAVLDQPDRTKAEGIIKALSLTVTPRELKSNDSRGLLQTMMTQWLPLSTAVLLAVIHQLPDPQEA
jgi:ribosome assembly protein 1